MKREFKKGDGTTARFAYIARERFGPWDGESWRKFLEWSRLSQLTETLSDSSLCPSIVDADCEEDWNHNIHEDHLTHYFWDLPYLRTKFASTASVSLLAVARNPATDPASWEPPLGFVYMGSDLVDVQTGISTLTNCGGFEDVFPRSEVSPLGLIVNWNRAVELQSSLAKAHPEEAHAQCAVWSIWRHHEAAIPTPPL